MKITILLLLCLVAILVNFCKNSEQVPEKGTEDLNAMMSELEKDGFSGSVLVAKGGKVQFNQGFGYAYREEEISAIPSTLYDIGSITKVFTKVGVLKLAENGKLSLDDPVMLFFDSVPADKKNITLRQLLYHTSGLREYHDTAGDFEKMTKEQAIAAIFSQNLPFEPGTKVSYSNSGYTLLAAIIEKVANQPYTAYIKQEVLQPCDLQKTGFYQSIQWKPEEVAVGYGAKKVGEKNSPYYWPKPEWALMGNGGLVASTEEYYKWLECLHKGSIISNEMVKEHVELNSMIAGSNDFGFNAVSYRRGNGQTILAFSNADNNSSDVIMRLLPVLNDQEKTPEDPAREKAVAKSVEVLHQALRAGNNEALQDFMKAHVSVTRLRQVSETALAEGLVGVQSHLGKLVILKDVQRIDNSLYRAAFKAEDSDNMASVMLLIESEAPYKIKGFSPNTGIDSGSDAADAGAGDFSNPWGLSAENGLAGVYIDMFRAFEMGTDQAIVDFVHRKMGDEFKNNFPIEAHVKILKGMRQKLGKNFKVENIQQKGTGELNLLVRAEDGITYQLKAETDPKNPRKLGGLMMSKK